MGSQIERAQQLRQYVRQIRDALDGIDALLEGADQPERDVYTRRRELLGYVYSREGVEKPELIKALREAGTAYQWIGQQVKRGYLSVTPLPTGKVRYTVTPRAVKEMHLQPSTLQEDDLYTALSSEAFAEDWDSPEDAVYDRL